MLVILNLIEKRIQKLVTTSLILVTLVVTPWLNLEPINLPKYFTLNALAFLILGLLLAEGLNSGNYKRSRTAIILFSFFIFQGILVFLFNAPSQAQIYGTYGRNTGLSTYISLAILALSTSLVGRKSFGEKILNFLILVSSINLFYGISQLFGRDPFAWQNPYNSIIGTLGNPNFVSALLGMGAIAIFARVLAEENIPLLIGLGTLMLGMLYISYKSDAFQGVAIFLVGALLVFYYKFVRPLSVYFQISYAFLVILGLVFSILGVLQYGPLRSVLYQASITYRGDYWRAGWKMTLENPLFGVGMDGYGDWYRVSRTEEAALRRGPDITSNSAHNVFLDISSNGGFPLLIAYLLILGLALRASIRILMRTKGYDFVGVGLVSCWIGYLVQSTISINQLGLAIWGWVLSGAIIGYEIFGDEKLVTPIQVQHQIIPPKALVTGSLGLVLGIVLSIGPMLQDISFRKALEKSDAVEIKEAALQWPRSVYYMDYAAEILLQNEVNNLALELSRESVKSNRRNFNGWKLLWNNPMSTSTEKREALEWMRKLDPFNSILPDK